MRRRLLAALLGIAVIAVLAFAVPAGLTEGARTREDAEVQLRHHVERVASLVPELFDASTVAVSAPVDPRDHRTAVYGIDGGLIAGRGPVRADAQTSEALGGRDSCRFSEAELVCVQPVLVGDRVVGAARAVHPASAIDGRVRAALLVVVIRALGMLVAAALAAVWLAGRLSRPIRELVAYAHAVGVGGAPADGGAGGAATVARVDSGIEEVDSTAAELAAGAARVRSLIERERAFSADVSHQLRTPIASLRVALETEQLSPRPDPTLILSEALADVERLEATVRELLALARDVPTDRQLVDLTAVTDEAARTWAPRLASAGRSLVLQHPSAEVPHVRVSRSAVVQILDVLLSNAERHGAGTVDLGLEATDGGVVLRVGDEGPGIAPGRATTGDVFRRRASAASGGHGIGLALAASLARAEGAHLELELPGPCPVFALHLMIEPALARADRLGPAA